MITPEDILNLNFYKKEKFTGSYKGMRYLIQKEHDEESDTDVFRAIYWPGPYNCHHRRFLKNFCHISFYRRWKNKSCRVA